MNPELGQVLSGPSGVIIYALAGAVIALAGVIVYLYKAGQKKDRRIDELQDLRVSEAERHVSEVVNPLNQLATQSDYIYKQALSNGYKRGD